MLFIQKRKREGSSERGGSPCLSDCQARRGNLDCILAAVRQTEKLRGHRHLSGTSQWCEKREGEGRVG